jgi:hypothetical protein
MGFFEHTMVWASDAIPEGSWPAAIVGSLHSPAMLVEAAFSPPRIRSVFVTVVLLPPAATL